MAVGDAARDLLLRHLISCGTLSESAGERAKTVSAQTHEHLEVVLPRLGLISDRELSEAFSAVLKLPLLAASDYPLIPVASDGLSEKFLRDNWIVPLGETPSGVALAVRNPIDSDIVDGVRFALGRTIIPKIGYPSDIEAALDRLYGAPSLVAAGDRLHASLRDDIDRLEDSASEAPVIRLVNQLIARAVAAGASDIHIEPMANDVCVRFRIDGVLQIVESPPLGLAPAIVSRVKVMSKLNIAERRMGQDGRVAIAVGGREIDFRVATTPSIHGECVTMRVLDRDVLDLDLPSLGFEPDLLVRFRAMLNRPHGIVLVTGPTGSGKTTTLYAALSELNVPEKKILTVEDPVEYKLDGINQIQVKPQIGLTFANALRSFLRHDPDIIMIGEIRDLEAAQIAIQAALTGHLILSTLHTNDAASAVTRLLDMGIEDYLLSSTMSGVVAQRLVRTLCESCKEPLAASPELLKRLNLERFSSSPMLHRAKGCDACRHTGFRGRTPIVEVLPFTDTLCNAVLRGSNSATVQSIAFEEGMQSMRDHGLHKALAGLTTIEEVLRATGVA